MPETAIAPRDEASDIALPIIGMRETINKGDISVTPAKVRIPAHHQYRIKAGREQDDQGNWVDKYRIGLTADGYDGLNRVVGAQFIIPEFIHDEKGERVRNPIHRSDYIYERMIAIWYNDMGQMQAYSEDLEVDFKVLYQQARLNASWKEPKLDGEGKPIMKRGRNGEYADTVTHYAKDHLKIARNEDGTAKLGDDGTPLFDVVLPDSAEAECLKRLYDLRATGLRYSQTVLKNRLMKVVTGIRMLPTDQIKPVSVEVMAFRDTLTPEQRIQRAALTQREVFGKALQAGATLNDDELATMNLDADSTDVLPVAEEAVGAVRNVTPDDEPTDD